MAVQPVAATDPQSFEQVLLGMPSVGKTARGIQVCPGKNFPHSLACFAESMTCTSRAATSCGSIASASAAANMSLAGATLAATRCGGGGQLQSGSGPPCTAPAIPAALRNEGRIDDERGKLYVYGKPIGSYTGLYGTQYFRNLGDRIHSALIRLNSKRI